MNKQLCKKNYTIQLRLAYYVMALLSLLGGMAIYAFFRDINNMILFRFFPKSSFLNNRAYLLLRTDSIWPYMFIYNLPYGLWCLSGLLFVRAIWLVNTKWRTIYSCTFIAIVILYVILKLPGIIPGTFDVLDLIFIGSFAFLENIVFIMFIKRRIL